MFDDIQQHPLRRASLVALIGALLLFGAACDTSTPTDSPTPDVVISDSDWPEADPPPDADDEDLVPPHRPESDRHPDVSAEDDGSDCDYEGDYTCDPGENPYNVPKDDWPGGRCDFAGDPMCNLGPGQYDLPKPNLPVL